MQFRLRGLYFSDCFLLRTDSTFLPRSPALRWLLLALFALHLCLGSLMGLSVDEAHYALYAAHPALSYFDHPPLVGWAQMPLVALQVPDSALRLVPGLLWLATVLGVYRVTVQLHVESQSAGAAAAGPLCRRGRTVSRRRSAREIRQPAPTRRNAVALR